MQWLSFLTYLFVHNTNIQIVQCQYLLFCLIFYYSPFLASHSCVTEIHFFLLIQYLWESRVCVWSEIGNMRMPACSRTLFSLRGVNFPVSSIIPGQSKVTQISIWKSLIHFNCALQNTLPFYDIFFCHAKVQPILTLPTYYMLNFALHVVFPAWLIYSGCITY